MLGFLKFGNFLFLFPIRSDPILIYAVGVLDLNNRVGLGVPTRKTVLEPNPNPSSDTDVRHQFRMVLRDRLGQCLVGLKREQQIDSLRDLELVCLTRGLVR
jgi:hypothetical protein